MKNKQSIEDIQKELNAITPQGRDTQAQPTQEKQKPDLNDPAYCKDFAKYPITDCERQNFEKALAVANRRKYGLWTDPEPDDIEGYVKVLRMVEIFDHKVQ